MPFAREFAEDLQLWWRLDPAVAMHVLAMIPAVARDPYHGEGNPTRLAVAGCELWSRRLLGRHRLVYRVRADRIDFLQARFHP